MNFSDTHFEMLNSKWENGIVYWIILLNALNFGQPLSDLRRNVFPTWKCLFFFLKGKAGKGFSFWNSWKLFLFGFIDMESFQELWKMEIGFPDAAAES